VPDGRDGASPSSTERDQAFSAEVAPEWRRGPSRKGGALSLMLGFLGLIAVAAVITFLIFAA